MSVRLVEPRSLRLTLRPYGEIREDSLFGKPYHVVPVVALVEGVVWPANVEQPEFVSAEVLAEHPIGWNGKPITQSHPQENGEFVSANYPWVYEKYAYGFIFNAEYRDGKLHMEAWIDPERVLPGSVAERSWETLQAGEMVEVSVGAYITKLKQQGEYKGQAYYAVWQDIIPDHLAILAEGEIGACSIEMGCGALRVAKAHTHTITDKGIEITEVEMAAPPPAATVCAKHPTQKQTVDAACPACLAENPPPAAKKSWTQRFTEALSRFVGLQSAEDMTTNDLTERLDRVLRSTQPGYLGVVAVKPEAHEVVYAVYPDDRVIYYQQTYAVADGGEVTVKGERQEVKYERIERYVPVAAAAAPSSPQPCGCIKPPVAAVQPSSGEGDMNKEVLIHALIGSGRFAEASRPYLATLEQPILEGLMAAPTPAAPSAPAPAAPAAAPAAPAPAAIPPATPSALGALSGASAQTMEQYIAAAPTALQPGLRAAHALQVAQRNATIKALKDTGRCTFTDDQLATKTDQELTQLAALASAPVAADFSGRGLPPSTDGDDVPEPPSLTAAITTRRSANRPH